MNCARLRPRFPAYLDGRVSPWYRWRIRSHLRRCRRCAEELAVLQTTLRAVRELPAPARSDLFWTNFHKRVMASLPPVPRRQPARRYSTRLVPALVTVTAALALALVLRWPSTSSQWVPEDWMGEELLAVAPWHGLSEEELEAVLDEIEEQETWPSQIRPTVAPQTGDGSAWEALDQLSTEDLMEVLTVLENVNGARSA